MLGLFDFSGDKYYSTGPTDLNISTGETSSLYDFFVMTIVL